MATVLKRKKEVEYPESDGKPMGETDVHRNEMADLIATLEDYYRDDPWVYVSGNLLVYYVEGNPKKRVSPDVFVVRGIRKEPRRTYKIWEEGKAPKVVIEVTSKKTRFEELHRKHELYRVLGVREYYLYDPTGDYLPKQFMAYRLKGSEYHEVTPKGNVCKSAILGLELKIEEGRLRLYDAHTGRRLLNRAELAAALQAAEKARRAAETELERLRTEMARLKKQS
jgi:Uma2 family endonuclease